MNIQSLSTSEGILLAKQLPNSARTKSDGSSTHNNFLNLIDGRRSVLEPNGIPGGARETLKKRIAVN